MDEFYNDNNNTYITVIIIINYIKIILYMTTKNNKQ